MTLGSWTLRAYCDAFDGEDAPDFPRTVDVNLYPPSCAEDQAAAYAILQVGREGEAVR